MRNNSQSTKIPQFGDVYYVNLPEYNSVQSGYRPAVIFQNNIGNAHSPNVIVLPMTSKLKKRHMPTHVFVKSDETGLPVDSMVLCENPICISKDNLQGYVTSLSDEYISKIAEANILASCSISYIDIESLMRIYRNAAELNSVKI